MSAHFFARRRLYGTVGCGGRGGGGLRADGRPSGGTDPESPGAAGGGAPGGGQSQTGKKAAGHGKRPVQPDQPGGLPPPLPRGRGPGRPLWRSTPPTASWTEFGGPWELLCRADSEGRVYPRSLQAAAVLQALRGACEEAGAILRCGWGVTGIRREEGGFRLETPKERPFGPPAACWPAEGRPLPSTPSPRGATGWPRAWATGSPPCGPASPACKAPRSACAP